MQLRHLIGRLHTHYPRQDFHPLWGALPHPAGFLRLRKQVNLCGCCRLEREVPENTLRQSVELQFCEDCFQLGRVGAQVGHLLEIARDGNIYHNGSQLFRQQGLLFVFQQVLALFLFVKVNAAGVHILDGVVIGQQFLGAHGAHAGHAGDVVGAVALQTENIDELLGAFDAVLLANLLRTEDFRRLAHLAWLVHLDVGRHQLAVVLVGGHHIDLKTLYLGVLGQGAHHVVGLIAVHLHNGHAEGLEDALDIGHGVDDIVGRGFAVGLVLLKLGVAESGRTRVKRHGDVGRLLVLHQLVEHIGEP